MSFLLGLGCWLRVWGLGHVPMGASGLGLEIEMILIRSRTCLNALLAFLRTVTVAFSIGEFSLPLVLYD